MLLGPFSNIFHHGRGGTAWAAGNAGAAGASGTAWYTAGLGVGGNGGGDGDGG